VNDDVGDIAMDKDFARRQAVIWFAGTRLSEQPIHKYSESEAARAW